MEIHNAGGGIHFTVEHTRRASEEELFRLLRERLIRMSKSGGSISPDSITLSPACAFFLFLDFFIYVVLLSTAGHTHTQKDMPFTLYYTLVCECVCIIGTWLNPLPHPFVPNFALHDNKWISLFR